MLPTVKVGSNRVKNYILVSGFQFSKISHNNELLYKILILILILMTYFHEHEGNFYNFKNEWK